MTLHFLLVALAIVNAGVGTDAKCKGGVLFKSIYYDIETLKTGLDGISNLAVDYNSKDILYFSYTDKQENFKPAVLDLDTKEFKEITDVPNGRTLAVDENTHDVYIGGTDGIYKYDYNTHKSKLYAEKDKNIKVFFFKDVLHFSNGSHVNTYINGSVTSFQDSEVNEFIIDREDTIFFTNNNGVYARREDGNGTVYDNNPEISYRAFALDIRGYPYMCDDKGIFKINKERISLEQVMDGMCQGLAFDSYNNMIYFDGKSLVRLIYNVHLRDYLDIIGLCVDDINSKELAYYASRL